MFCVLKNRSFEYPQHMFWLRNKKIIFSHALLSGGLNSRRKIRFLNFLFQVVCTLLIAQPIHKAYDLTGGY